VRNTGAAAALHRLDDHDAGVRRQLAGVLAIAASVHGPGQPGGERLAEAFDPRRRQRKQSGAVVGALECDDARLSRREQGSAEGDLDGVLAGDAQLGGPRQRLPQALRRLRLGEVAERVHHWSLRDRLPNPRIAVTEHGDSETARQVDVLAAVLVPDATAFGTRPDQRGTACGADLRTRELRSRVRRK
jgi:hypothetical protein